MRKIVPRFRLRQYGNLTENQVPVLSTSAGLTVIENEAILTIVSKSETKAPGRGRNGGDDGGGGGGIGRQLIDRAAG